MGTKSYISIGGVVALVVIVGFFLWRTTQPSDEAETKQRGTESVVISYTDEGYFPNEVTIRAGEAVRWVNNSSREMWPASAVHPTHSIYPQKSDSDCLGSSFDACERLTVGSTWEFTFNEAGEWKFHDHVRPSKTGTVFVKK